MVFANDNYYNIFKKYYTEHYETDNRIRIIGIYYYKPYKPEQVNKFKDFLQKRKIQQ